MDDAKAEALAFTAFPREHLCKIWSTSRADRHARRIDAGDCRYLSDGSMATLYDTSDTDRVAAIESSDM